MKKVAILIENLFDDQELIYPYHRLREDYEVVLVGSEKDEHYKSKSGLMFKSDIASEAINADDFAGIFIPGGFSPDYMRRTAATVDLVKAFDKAKKPIAAICHGPWMLASANAIKGKNVTSVVSIKDDLVHAGGHWVDEEVVVSGHIITSRSPRDLPALIKTFVSML
ncbi:MAG TPA: protease [Clostridiales bacterium UBA8960]|jgi:protease I|nr:protease [Clostridiales bacterium UBA8960]